MINIMNKTYCINEWKYIKNIIDEKLEIGYDIDIEFLYYDFIKFNLNINSGVSTLIIKYINENNLDDVKTLFLDILPYVDILEFNSSLSLGLNYLENKLQNLPITISFIKFNLIYLDENIVNTGKFNFLFNIKKPFNCKIILNVINDANNQNIGISYIVNETDNNEKLELKSKNNKIIINKIIINYCSANPKITLYKYKYRKYTNFTMTV